MFIRLVDCIILKYPALMSCVEVISASRKQIQITVMCINTSNVRKGNVMHTAGIVSDKVMMIIPTSTTVTVTTTE